MAAASAACAFTAQEPLAYQPQGLIGLKSASLPQHEMLTDVGESGQNAKNSHFSVLSAYHPIATGERTSRVGSLVANRRDLDRLKY